MCDENCTASEALERAKAELEKAQAFYDHVRQQAAEGFKVVRETTIGDAVKCTLETAKRRPCASIAVAAAVGFFLGRLFRR